MFKTNFSGHNKILGAQKIGVLLPPWLLARAHVKQLFVIVSPGKSWWDKIIMTLCMKDMIFSSCFFYAGRWKLMPSTCRKIQLLPATRNKPKREQWCESKRKRQRCGRRFGWRCEQRGSLGVRTAGERQVITFR